MEIPKPDVVAPGIIASPIADDVFSKEMIEQMVPMKRVGPPNEVAALVSFLASDQAGYISGQAISNNGGWHSQEARAACRALGQWLDSGYPVAA